jgi:hypothetical protein
MFTVLCELIWAIRLSAASVVAPYWDPTSGSSKGIFGGKFLKMETSQSRASAAPYLEFSLLSGAL